MGLALCGPSSLQAGLPGALVRFSALWFRTIEMAGITLNVDVREGTGTGAARAVRNAGNVPGILYGGSLGPVNIAMPEKELVKAIYSGKLLGHMVTLSHKGDTQPVIPRDVQFDPVTDRPIHFDLYRVEENSIITVEVQVRFLNEETCPGLKKGGALNVVRHVIELAVPAGKIPEHLDVDLSKVEIGDVIHMSAIKLPEGAKPTIRDRDFTVATIIGRGPQAKDDTAEEAAS
jgi:large subunit ribosomal protein L25